MAAAVTHAQVDLASLNERRTKERTPEPTVVVIFGASGDLTKRKLLPALGIYIGTELRPADKKHPRKSQHGKATR